MNNSLVTKWHSDAGFGHSAAFAAVIVSASVTKYIIKYKKKLNDWDQARKLI